MFAYIDPAVKQELLRDGKLFAIDANGMRCCTESTDRHPFVSIVGPVPLPVRVGKHGKQIFQWYVWVRRSELDRIEQVVDAVRKAGPKEIFALLSDHMSVNSVLVYGDFARAKCPPVRVHSNCLTGDVFGSMRCDCGPQLMEALERIVDDGAGALVYMAGHEGRGIGLWAKAITYLLQDAGHDTYQANEKLGLPVDSRDYSDAGRLLVFLRGKGSSVRLLSNNPGKREAIEAMGVVVAEQTSFVSDVNPHNVRYLSSKREHGHTIPPGALESVVEEKNDS